jgi:hypothetical protein
MAKQVINIGTTPGDGTGDPARVAFNKANDNFTELYDGLDAKLDDSQASAFGLTLLDDVDAATARATLGLGTLYTDEMAQDAIGLNVGNGLDYDDGTGAISVDETELVHNSIGSKQGGAAGEFYHLTAAQHTLVQNATASFTTTQETKLGHITVTQAVNLDTIESDTATNNSKITNQTHTGHIAGATTTTLQKEAITDQATVVAALGDLVLVSDASDANNLKKVTVQTIIDLAPGGGGSLNVSYSPGSFTIPTESSRQFGPILKLVSSERATLQGTARLQVRN